MRFWSEGLGKQEIVLDFTGIRATREGNKAFIRGSFLEPEPWNFQIIITREDIKGFLHIIFSSAMLRYILRNLGSGLFRLMIITMKHPETKDKYKEV